MTNEPLKKTKLNKKNWEYMYSKDGMKTYQHKTRKKVQVVIDKKNGTGYFYDNKTKKVFSEIKKIIWV